MKLRLHFPSNYPISPPFVWLVSPRLALRTGFVSRGAICTTMLVRFLHTSVWCPRVLVLATGSICMHWVRALLQLGLPSPHRLYKLSAAAQSYASAPDRQ